MKIGFIGAGKVGFTLGKYFKLNKIDVTGYYSRTSESAKEAADFTLTAYFDTLEKLIAVSNVIFLTVPDTAIRIVWNEIKHFSLQGKIICHCSGILSSDIFTRNDIYGCSLHPLYAVNSKYKSYENIGQAVFTAEGGGFAVMKDLLEVLGHKVHVITAEQKIKYHTAAVFLSNHITALAHIGSKLLRECGFDGEFTETAVRTLFAGQCRQISETGISGALTGPVERGDCETVKKHIECLNGDDKNIYILLTKQLIEIAKEKNPDYDYPEMEDYINEF